MLVDASEALVREIYLAQPLPKMDDLLSAVVGISVRILHNSGRRCEPALWRTHPGKHKTLPWDVV